MKNYLSLFFSLLLLAVAGCGGSSGGSDDPEPTLNLTTSIRLLDNFDQPADTFTQDETIQIELTVINNGPDEAVLSFNSGQQVEFEVTDSNDAIMWRLSESGGWTQELTEIRLQPGATNVALFEWDQSIGNSLSLETGSYTMRGWYLNYANTSEVTFDIQ